MRRLLQLAVLSIFAAPAFASGPTCVQGKAGVAPTATLTFTAPTSNTDGTSISSPLTYNLYIGTASGTEKLAASALAGSPIAVNTGLTPGSTFYFEVTTVENGVESTPSNEVCKAFAASIPGTVVITIQ